MITVFIIKHEHGLDALLESYGKAYVGKQVLKLSFFICSRSSEQLQNDIFCVFNYRTYVNECMFNP